MEQARSAPHPVSRDEWSKRHAEELTAKVAVVTGKKSLVTERSLGTTCIRTSPTTLGLRLCTCMRSASISGVCAITHSSSQDPTEHRTRQSDRHCCLGGRISWSHGCQSRVRGGSNSPASPSGGSTWQPEPAGPGQDPLTHLRHRDAS